MSATRDQRRNALAALAVGASQEQAATAAQVEPRTIRRWLRTPEFRRDLDLLHDISIRQALAKLVSGLTSAVDKIAGLVETGDSDSVKLRAAEMMIANALRVREQVSVTTLLLDLDAKMKDLQSGKPNPARRGRKSEDTP